METTKETWVAAKMGGVTLSDYEASSFGRVRRSTGSNAGRVLACTPNDKGYPQFRITVNGRLKSCRVHIVVAESFLGRRPEGAVINHRDGDKKNNRVNNLEYCTPSENRLHALRLGLAQPLAPIKAADVPDETVREISRLLADGMTSTREISRVTGANVVTVTRVVFARKWRHLLD